MGIAFVELIDQALLLDNPGVTREEFIALINSTHYTQLIDYRNEDSWSSYDSKLGRNSSFENDLERLARVLCLGESEKYKKFQTPGLDENNISLFPPQKSDQPILKYSREEIWNCGMEYKIVIHERNVLLGTRRVRTRSNHRLKPGQEWYNPNQYDEPGIILKIYSERPLKDIHDKPRRDRDIPRWGYDMKVQRAKQEWRIERFATKKGLFRLWPEFSPEFMYDWEQKDGHFSSGIRGTDNILWLNQEGKYYLDRRTFDRIGAGFSNWGLQNPDYWGYINSVWGYTDLIVTAEAIKQKAWKLFSHHGQGHISSFIGDFPNSRERYERAIWDAHTSLYAKKAGMTVSEFLRFRTLGTTQVSGEYLEEGHL
jgi:hypothetical protein